MYRGLRHHDRRFMYQGLRHKDCRSSSILQLLITVSMPSRQLHVQS